MSSELISLEMFGSVADTWYKLNVPLILGLVLPKLLDDDCPCLKASGLC